MTIVQAVVLGIVQGLTEFLPVSSSAHLVFVQRLLPGFAQDGVVFDVVLHAGTFFAVVYYFKKDLLKLSKNYITWILVGSIPAGAAGILFSDFFESLFSLPNLAGLTLMITGLLNLATNKIQGKEKKITIKNALFVGLAQAFAIIPGISRSGSTIFTARSLGIRKTEAVRFSFLLSLPAIVGANLVQFIKYGVPKSFEVGPYFLGFLSAITVGYLAIKLVFTTLKENKFSYFGYYSLIVGFLALLFF